MKIIEKLPILGTKFKYIIFDLELSDKNTFDDFEIDMKFYNNYPNLIKFLEENDYKEGFVTFLYVQEDFNPVILFDFDTDYKRRIYFYSQDVSVYNEIYNEIYS